MTLHSRLKNLIFITIITITSAKTAFSQKDEYREKLETIAAQAQGTVGVGIKNLQTGETLILNEKHKFPMLSVFKFPLAMAILNQVDKGKLSLTQKVHVTEEDMRKTYSPLRDKYPEGNVDVSVADLLTYSVSLSDNNACDLLFRLLGGPGRVQKYVHQELGVTNIAIVADEEEMGKAWDVQYTNWCEPAAMLRILEVFYEGKKLSAKSTEFLTKIMVEGPTGANRIKGALPKNTLVAHKTGTSSTNDGGLTAAVNDAGLVQLPDGSQLSVVVFISDTRADTKTCESVISQISRAAWEYYTTNR